MSRLLSSVCCKYYNPRKSEGDKIGTRGRVKCVYLDVYLNLFEEGFHHQVHLGCETKFQRIPNHPCTKVSTKTYKQKILKVAMLSQKALLPNCGRLSRQMGASDPS